MYMRYVNVCNTVLILYHQKEHTYTIDCWRFLSTLGWFVSCTNDRNLQQSIVSSDVDHII